jgi:Family of unknown function (DUF6169)
MFGDFLPASVPIYTFNIEVFQTPEITTHLSTPIDKRIEVTIKYILIQFFDCIDNVMIYICDNLDSRHQARERKFDSWFKSAKISDIEKINFKTITDDFEVLSAILLHSQNPYKKQIIALMTQLNDNDFMPL